MNTKQRTIFILLGCIALLIGVGVFSIAKETHTESRGEAVSSADVLLTDKGFQPREIVLKKGGVVTFSTSRDKPFWPASDLHPSHGIYPEFDPGRPLLPSESWSFTFDKVGEWNMHDHLRSYFTGTIYVVE